MDEGALDEPDWSEWRAARSLAELGELGARFLEGDLEDFPGWLPGAPDEETEDLEELLARACRAGFLTLASQPAGAPHNGADGRTERRRAFVFGFAAPALATRLAAAAEELGLLAFDHPAEGTGGEPLAVAERGGEAFLLVGDAQGPAELELFDEALSEAGRAALRSGRYLVLVDPQWSRDDRLWSLLDRVLASGPG